MTVAKGITNGAVPMGAVFVRHDIYETVVNAVESGIEFFHGYTYTGHPLACAGALATLAVYREEGLFERAASLAPYWEEAIHSLRGEPHVIDIRNLGLVAGIELESRPGKPGTRALDGHIDCFNRGLLIRVTADIIALSPPLIIEKSEIDQLVEILKASLRRLA
jgi:beta-alanine--pyruvate transaminase